MRSALWYVGAIAALAAWVLFLIYYVRWSVRWIRKSNRRNES